MIPVLQGIAEFKIARYAAHIFRWAGQLRSQFRIEIAAFFENKFMWLLGDHHHHNNHGQDHNLRAAYLHVATDALTSVLAIIALIFGNYLGWSFLDPAMGIVGGILIGK